MASDHCWDCGRFLPTGAPCVACPGAAVPSYPNVEAVAIGATSGRVSDWTLLRPECRALLDEVAKLREQVRREAESRREAINFAVNAALEVVADFDCWVADETRKSIVRQGERK